MTEEESFLPLWGSLAVLSGPLTVKHAVLLKFDEPIPGDGMVRRVSAT
jgi:hypothetical protein